MAQPRKQKPTRDTWGSITAMPGGGWRLRYLGPDGRRRSGGVFRTKAAAEEARARLHTAVAGGVWRPSAPGDSPTLAVYADAWLTRAARDAQLSPRTVALYRRQLDRLVLPDVGGIELGRVPIGRIRRETVAEWEAAAANTAHAHAKAHLERANGAAESRRRGHPARSWARRQGLDVPQTGRLPADVLAAWHGAGSPEQPRRAGTARATGDRQFEQARTALSSVCTAAVEEGLLAEHPVRMRPGTKGRARSRSTTGGAFGAKIDIVSVEAAFALAESMPDPFRVAALVTTFAGLRGGETFALAHRHLRYAEPGRVSHIRVERSLLELPGEPIAFGPTKTGAGQREIAIPDRIGELLAAHAASDSGTDPDKLVFHTLAGTPISRTRRSAVMVAARTRAGLPGVTWHTLRHTGLTLAASVPGVTVRNLMDRGGHSTARAALIYQHTAAAADTQLAIGLGKLIDDQAAVGRRQARRKLSR